MAEKKLNLDDPKYDVLKRILSEQGRDIDEEIVAHLEALCEELVPKNAEETMSEFPENSYAIIRFSEGDDIFCFASSSHLTLYDSGKLYIQAEEDGKLDFSFDSLAYEYYGEDGLMVINDTLFSSLVKAMPVDERITAAIEYDFESMEVRVYERDGEKFKRYDIDDFKEAIEKSDYAAVSTEKERDAFIRDDLSGKELPQQETGGLTMQM